MSEVSLVLNDLPFIKYMMNPYSIFKSRRVSCLSFTAALIVFLASIIFYIHAFDYLAEVPSLKWSLHPSTTVQTPKVPSVFPMPALEPVLMSIENSNRYRFSASERDTTPELDEWKALLPNGNGTVYLDVSGGKRDAFTISLFHQLRCLDIVRASLVSFRDAHTRSEPNRLAQHCMNYLRQMVLCRSNTQLQSVRNHTGTRITVSDVTTQCKDWTAVYTEVEKNYARYGG